MGANDPRRWVKRTLLADAKRHYQHYPYQVAKHAGHGIFGGNRYNQSLSLRATAKNLLEQSLEFGPLEARRTESSAAPIILANTWRSSVARIYSGCSREVPKRSAGGCSARSSPPNPRQQGPKLGHLGDTSARSHPTALAAVSFYFDGLPIVRSLSFESSDTGSSLASKSLWMLPCPCAEH